MQNDVTCVKVNSRRESIVARVQPADVRVYSYYNPGLSLFIFEVFNQMNYFLPCSVLIKIRSRVKDLYMKNIS